MSDLPPAITSWRDQIERLSEHASPCRYLTPARWAAMRANALAFINEHGAETHRLGWTAPQLFGVHPEHGFQCVEYAGGLMVNDSRVVGVEPDRIVFDRFSGYRTKPGQSWGPPVWEFAAQARRVKARFGCLRLERDTSCRISGSDTSLLPPRSAGSLGL